MVLTSILKARSTIEVVLRMCNAVLNVDVLVGSMGLMMCPVVVSKCTRISSHVSPTGVVWMTPGVVAK